MSVQETPPLVAAAKKGDFTQLRKLVEQGHDLKVQDKHGATALYWACCRGYEQISQFLLDAGCDVTVRVKWGATALMAAADNGHATCTKQLLDSHAEVNVSSNRGDTALHVAAYRGHLDVLKLLVKYQADPFVKNSLSLTAIQEAYTQRHEACVQLLSQYMATTSASGVSSAVSLPTHTSDSHVTLSSMEGPFRSWPREAKTVAPPLMTFSENGLQQFLSDRPQRESIYIPSMSAHGHFISHRASNCDRVTGPPSLYALDRELYSFESLNSGISEYHTCRKIENASLSDLGEARKQDLQRRDTAIDGLSLKENLAWHTSLDSANVTCEGGENDLLGCDLATDQCSLLSLEDNSSWDTSTDSTNATHEGRIPPRHLQNLTLESCSSSPAQHGQEYSPAPELPPRPAFYKKQNDQPLIENKFFPPRELADPQPKLKNIPQTTKEHTSSKAASSSKPQRVARELMPGVRVGEFVEQIQIQMLELQEKLKDYENLTSQLKDEEELLRRENAVLKNENSYLRSVFLTPVNRPLRARGSVGDTITDVLSTSNSQFYFSSLPPQARISIHNVRQEGGEETLVTSKAPVNSSDKKLNTEDSNSR